MTAARPTMSPSPAASNFPVMKQDSAVKPNPHPYAIRTSSTGLLSRSNSSGHNTATSRHHYVPVPTSPTHRRDARRSHKHTKSLNEDPYVERGSPQPLPVPSSFISNARSGLKGMSSEQLPQRRRAETLPPNLTGSNVPADILAAAEDLPSNPKLWGPSQLASYLLTALRTRGLDMDDSANLSASAIPAVAEYVQNIKLSGRIFLRLNEEDMATMSIDVSWRDALLAASRNLRQSVIKGRIWGAGTDSPPSGSHSPSLPSQPFSPLYDSSSSSVELTDDEEVAVTKRRRVRGRVRGMVESFERSGSFSSESGADDDAAPPDRSMFKQWLTEKAVPENAVVLPCIASPTETGAVQEIRPFVEEPTVETLLAEIQSSGTWGARAWEEFDSMEPGVTVKRASEHAAGDHSKPDDNVDRETWMQSVKRGSLAKRQKERRVVTAVFAPAVEEPTEELPGTFEESLQDAAPPPKLHEQAVQAPVEMLQADDEISRSQLQAELRASRALADAYKKRLEDVEAKVAELECQAASREREIARHADIEVQASPSQTLHGPEEAVRTNSLINRPNTVSVSSLLAIGSSLLPPVLQRAIFGRRRFSSTRTRGDAPPRRDPDYDGPSSMSELPQYMLLVGLGVCTVVLRLMLKKSGKRT